jgi:hypothetical protein
MRKTIIALALAALAATVIAQVSVDVDIAVPKIVKLIIGNQGRVVYDLNERIWEVDIDAVNSRGETSAYKSAQVTMESVYVALEANDPSVNWREKAPMLIEVIKGLAIAQE